MTMSKKTIAPKKTITPKTKSPQFKAKSPTKHEKRGGGIELSDQQLVALSGAAQRDDQTIPIPRVLSDDEIAVFAAALVKAGLAAEAPATRGQPIWRQDDARGQRLTLRVTDKALAALGIDEANGSPAIDSAPPAPAMDGVTPRTPPQPLAGSKQGQLITMLSRKDGASISEIATALGWLPHTTRAALTGLRHKGYELGREISGGTRGGVYRITAAPVAAFTANGPSATKAA
jgi:hypothetical protein